MNSTFALSQVTFTSRLAASTLMPPPKKRPTTFPAVCEVIRARLLHYPVQGANYYELAVLKFCLDSYGTPQQGTI